MVLDRVHTEKSDSGDSTRLLRMLSYITAAMVSIFVAWFTGYIRTDGTLDTDGWFLLASGREIVHNGIPFENPWSLDPGQGIIVQQPMSCRLVKGEGQLNGKANRRSK